MNGTIAYILSKGYTDETVIGGGAIKGKNCVIDSIEDIEGGHKVTFMWTLDDGTEQRETMNVMDGEKGETGERGEKGDTGAAGKDGFAPQVEVEKSTSNEYILKIQDVDSEYDTPNLKGSSGGVIASYDEEDENVTLS